MSRKRVRLIHWNQAEAEERADRIRKWGFQVDDVELDPASYREIRFDPPNLIVIDLTRLPSHGRELAIWLRNTKATRHVPILFVDGLPEKIDRVKKSLPDAIFTTWSRLQKKIEQNIDRVESKPHVPGDNMAGYSGTPLPKKLGIKESMTVGLIGAPESFAELLEPLPSDVSFKKVALGRASKRQPELFMWFPKSRSDLEDRIDQMADRVEPKAGVWICWAKQASGMQSDLTQAIVRKVGLASGMVDFKICSINEIYSGLKFTHRKKA